MRMESETRDGADAMAHKAASVVVLDGGAQFSVVAVHVDVLTDRTAGKYARSRVNRHGRHTLRSLDRVDGIRIPHVHEPHVSGEAALKK